ncbi:MAG: hypothetical protein M5U09_23235 [Gammaproteobacteria bacterium]|nr:hypothetical protein [Gammaproteobacteria bacterium]
MTTAAQTEALLAWYHAAARDLPWRGETDPYRIWVSEIMPQQTQVETVKPYYARWLERFPTVGDLAAADLQDVLACWQGLGYYRRARALHAAAKVVVAEHGGRLPADPAALATLPGIGDYTAGAIASIAFGAAAPAIDGNVARVICRLDAIGDNPALRRGSPRGTRPGGRAAAHRPAGRLQPGLDGTRRHWSAPPVRPACGTCPWWASCRARAAGDVARYPVKAPSSPPRSRRHVAAVIRRSGRLAGRPPACRRAVGRAMGAAAGRTAGRRRPRGRAARRPGRVARRGLRSAGVPGHGAARGQRRADRVAGVDGPAAGRTGAAGVRRAAVDGDV